MKYGKEYTLTKIYLVVYKFLIAIWMAANQRVLMYIYWVMKLLFCTVLFNKTTRPFQIFA